jgi:hypothetical protein
MLLSPTQSARQNPSECIFALSGNTLIFQGDSSLSRTPFCDRSAARLRDSSGRANVAGPNFFTSIFFTPRAVQPAPEIGPVRPACVQGVPMQTSVWSRLLGSRKFWIALVGVIASVAAAMSLPDAKVVPVVSAITILGAAVVAAIGYEDGKQKGGPNIDAENAFIGSKHIPPPSANVLLALILPAFLLLGGCQIGSSYVAADRATYEAIAPEYTGYLAADPKLDDSQKDRRRRTVQTWERRIEAAEKAATAVPTTRPTQ